MAEESQNTKMKNLLLTLVIIVLIGFIVYFIWNDSNKKTEETTTETAQEQSAYQAVFLTNGQVYFGKIDESGNTYIKLTDIYHLQAQEGVQPAKDGEEEPNLTLIKLGKELHAPADEMNINREHVLFWENIEEEGKVMQAIKEYKANN